MFNAIDLFFALCIVFSSYIILMVFSNIFSDYQLKRLRRKIEKQRKGE